MLLIGAILTPGRRTVASALRVMGLAQTPALSELSSGSQPSAMVSATGGQDTAVACWLPPLCPKARFVIGGDETLERRQGEKIAKKGIYKDSARSSKSFFVKSSGLRWIVFMLLVPIPWANRTWALPFFAVLAPSERYHQERKKRHKTLAIWARQMLWQVRRWLPERQIVFVGDGSYSVLELLLAADASRSPSITRLRLDAGLYAPPPPPKPKGSGRTGRPRVKGDEVADAGSRLPPIRRRRWTTVARAALVQSGRTGSRDRLCLLPVVQSRPDRAVALGTDPRSTRQVYDTGPAVYRPDDRSGADPRLVCAALATGSDVPGSANASGRGDPASME